MIFLAIHPKILKSNFITFRYGVSRVNHFFGNRLTPHQLFVGYLVGLTAQKRRNLK
jgi:hypothetical protein